MKRLGGMFVDRVTGNPVDCYRDTFGRHWMAQGAWDLGRVRRSDTLAGWEFGQ
jgi:hypothetical protein